MNMSISTRTAVCRPEVEAANIIWWGENKSGARTEIGLVVRTEMSSCTDQDLSSRTDVFALTF